jgi:hypothetical protein
MSKKIDMKVEGRLFWKRKEAGGRVKRTIEDNGKTKYNQSTLYTYMKKCDKHYFVQLIYANILKI